MNRGIQSHDMPIHKVGRSRVQAKEVDKWLKSGKAGAR